MSLDGSVVALNKSHRPSKPASRFLSPECLSHSRQKTLTRQKTNTKLLCFFCAPAQMLKKGVTKKQTPPKKKIIVVDGVKVSVEDDRPQMSENPLEERREGRR